MHEEEEIPEGCAHFTLMPQTTSCIPSFFPITTGILYSISRRIFDTTGGSVDVFSICKMDNGQGRRTYATTGEFQQAADRMW
jgi:hypothetical protein